MNSDRYVVYIQVPRNETIQPEVTTIWRQVSAYDSFEQAKAHAFHCKELGTCLAIRIRRHQFIETTVLEEAVTWQRSPTKQ